MTAKNILSTNIEIAGAWVPDKVAEEKKRPPQRPSNHGAAPAATAPKHEKKHEEGRSSHHGILKVSTLAKISSMPPRSPTTIATTAGSTSTASSSSAPPRPQHVRHASAPVKLESSPGTTSSLETLQESLERLKRRYGERHALVAQTRNLIGNAYFRREEYQLALEEYKLAALRCSDPGRHLADSYSNIATIYWSNGRVNDAIEFLVQSQKIHRYYDSKLSNHNPASCAKLAAVQHQLGLAYALQQQGSSSSSSAQKAVEHLKAARDSFVRAHGGTKMHADVARVLDALGKLHVMRGDYREAKLCQEESLCIKRQLLLSKQRQQRPSARFKEW